MKQINCKRSLAKENLHSRARTLRPLNPQEKRILKNKILGAVVRERIEGIPLQLPKTEQNQLPADCGHPLTRHTYQQQMGQFPNITASVVSENEGSA